MNLFFAVLLIIVGFVLLIKGADFLVSGAASLAKRLNVSDLAIGLTIVAMGTSAPELVVNLIAGSGEGNNSVVFGNILGSNIFNTYLILGVASVIYPLKVQPEIIRKDLPYSIGSLLLLALFANQAFLLNDAPQGELKRWHGATLLIIFSAYLLHTMWAARRSSATLSGEESEEIKILSGWKTFLLIAGGVIGLTVGGDLVVEHAVWIAEQYGVQKKVIGLTILAAGTSLPELATTVVAALNRKSDLAVGNIVGSNIFNILLILGCTALFTSTPRNPLLFELSLNYELSFTIFGMILMFLFMYTIKRSKVDRSEGFVLLLFFGGYCYWIYRLVALV